MAKLSDTQRILLSTASRRGNGSLLPLPLSIAPGGGTAKAIAAILKRGLAEERETNEWAAAHRRDGDIHHGVFLTQAGATAIGVEAPELAASETALPNVETQATCERPSRLKPPSKIASVLALLDRPEGASLAQLIETTGWLPHTTRAALSGIRKKGHDVTRSKRDGATSYRIIRRP